MPLVNVMVNGKAYTIACDEGEEEHLKELGATVDGKVKELLSAVGNVGDQRLVLMAALLLADELHGVSAQLETLRSELAAAQAAQTELNERAEKTESMAADALENAVKRIEDIAAKIKAA